jgi:predicted acylesterase/phospholipase RssA
MPDAIVPNAEPYVGPRPFELGEENKYFGREEEARDFYSLVVAHELVLLYATSGAGKTSLIKAGLAPLLADQFEIYPVARVRGLTREDGIGKATNLYVANALASLGVERAELSTPEPVSLKDFLSRRAESRRERERLPYLVVFDQFEELFAVSPEPDAARKEFFEQVRDALAADHFLRVVFSMREDFVAELDPYAELLPNRMRTRFRLERLRKAAALVAVQKPLEGTGRSFEPGAAKALVAELARAKFAGPGGTTIELSGDFVEPVQLQIVCQTLWRKLPPDTALITEATWKAYGNVNTALAGFYEDCLREVVASGHASEGELRKWFDEVLITVLGTRGAVVRGGDRTGGIPNAAVEQMEHLHLIRREIRSGATWYELTHDRFIEPIQQTNKSYFEARERDRQIERHMAEEKAAFIAKTAVDTRTPDEGGLTEGTALCFSGGGYRGLLFHLGALWRLNELGYLPKLDRICGVSTGSIIAGWLGLRWKEFDFSKQGVAANFQEGIVAPLRRLTETSLDTGVVIINLLFGSAVESRLIGSFRHALFGKATLQDFPDKPSIMLNSTNLQSGVQWRFSKAHTWDFRVGQILNPKIEIAVAAAASCSLTPVFPPVELHFKDSQFVPDSGTDLHKPLFTSNVSLIDGAIYDPLAIESCWKRYSTLLVSDAATGAEAQAELKKGFAALFARSVELIAVQARNVRKRQLIDSFLLGSRKGAYWSLRARIADYELADALEFPPEKVHDLCSIPARMRALPRDVQDELINWGYAVCDAAIRRHMEDRGPPPAWPYPGATK